MNPFLFDVLLIFVASITGAAGASWFWWSHLRRKTVVRSTAEAQRAAKAKHAASALIRLEELATRVAFDVDEHSSQVEEINDELTSADKHDRATIVDVVAKLIDANQHMNEKLASTEEKLREQAKQIQTHAAEARTDALTMLANRRAFDEELAHRIAEFRRQDRPFSLIMADVDHFKKFNDVHGHQAGDAVLRGVSKQLRRKMREMDMVARYGGEEFAIVLPATKLEEACKAALRACEGIKKAHFHKGEADLKVTASFGVAQVQGIEDGPALIARADKALYAAKQGGHNCVFRHDKDGVQRVAPKSPPALAEAGNQTQPKAGQPAGEKTGPAANATQANAEAARAADLGVMAEIPNRANFCHHIRSRTAEFKRGGPVFSIVLMAVNDRSEVRGGDGQKANEFAARAAGRFVVSAVREMDVVGQFASDCLALLLPTAKLSDAVRIAERLREGFSQCGAPAEGDQPRLTMSVGVVQVMESDDSILVLKRAEAALDAAGQQGGNRVLYHDGRRCAPVTAMLETMGYMAGTEIGASAAGSI